MKVSALYNYPVKSLGGIKLKTAKVEKRGLENDRRFMFIDKENNFVTARTQNKLGGIDVVIKNDELIFTNNHNNSNVVQPIVISSKKINSTIWDSKSNCHFIDNNVIDEWISDFIGEDIRLVYMADDDIRVVNQKYAKPDEIVSFADGFPLLVTNTKSLEDLNSRMDENVNMSRFRPNIVIEGNIPWEEDNWEKIKIGDVIIRLAKPCARCVVTTINPDTGIKGVEPLHTLSKFRKVGNKVMFGINSLAEKLGTINVGDSVELLK